MLSTTPGDGNYSATQGAGSPIDNRGRFQASIVATAVTPPAARSPRRRRYEY